MRTTAMAVQSTGAASVGESSRGEVTSDALAPDGVLVATGRVVQDGVGVGSAGEIRWWSGGRRAGREGSRGD